MLRPGIGVQARRFRASSQVKSSLFSSEPLILIFGFRSGQFSIQSNHIFGVWTGFYLVQEGEEDGRDDEWDYTEGGIAVLAIRGDCPAHVCKKNAGEKHQYIQAR